MSKSKFSKSNSYDEIVRELSILNLLNHIHKIRKNLKMSFLDTATRSSSSSDEGASVKRGKKQHHKSGDEDSDIVEVKESPLAKVKKNSKQAWKEMKSSRVFK